MDKFRLKNLALQEMTYLLPKDKWPEHISYGIDYYYPNPNYGHESEFENPIVDGEVDTNWYYKKGQTNVKYHKSCFKHPENCFTIAMFVYQDNENCYELRFVGDRPLSLNKEEKETFWTLIEYGYNKLNHNDNDY